MMKQIKKAFLLVVGTLAVAYEEGTKALKQQQHKLNERMNRKSA